MSATIKQIDKKKILAPKLRFKEFHETWSLLKLSELLEFKNGINASKEQYGRGFKFINVLDILNNDYITHDAIIGSVDVDEATVLKYPVNYGDILFQRSSETREEVGTACVYLDTKTATFGGFVIRGRKIGNYDPMFLNKLLKTDLSRNEITSKSGGSTRYNVGQETLSSVALHFPTLPEQQKIASFLSAIDEKIQQLTRKKELLEQYKKGVMQQLFSGKLRFKDKKGNAYPNWENKLFGDVCNFINGKAYKQEELLSQGKYRVLRVGNLFSNNEWYYSDLELENNKYIENGDLIYAWSATFGPRFWEEEKVIYHYHIWKVIPNDLVDKYFLYHAFDFDVERIKAVSQGGTMFHITKGNIETRKFNFPCKEEQQKIASFLSCIDNKLESVANQIKQTQTFKKGLLQQMFV